MVYIRRAGQVIPEVIGPIVSKRTGKEKEFSLLEKITKEGNPECPVCGGAVIRPEGEAMYYCTNAACPAQLQEHIEHFASRGAMDIRGIGESMAVTLTKESVVKEGEGFRMVMDVSDIYYIDKEQIAGLEHKGEKSAGNIMAAIEKSKNRHAGEADFCLGHQACRRGDCGNCFRTLPQHSISSGRI